MMRFLMGFIVVSLWAFMASAKSEWVTCKSNSYDQGRVRCFIGHNVEHVLLVKKFRKAQCRDENWGVNFRKGFIWVKGRCHALFRVTLGESRRDDRDRGDRDRGDRDRGDDRAKPRDCRKRNNGSLVCPGPLNPRRWTCEYRPRRDQYICWRKNRSDNDGSSSRCSEFDDKYRLAFRKIESFAYSSSGLDYSSSKAASYAHRWLKRHKCGQAKRFVRVGKRLKKFAYSSSGLDYNTRKSAGFVASHIEQFCTGYSLEERFKRAFRHAYYDLDYSSTRATKYALRRVREDGAFDCDAFK